MLSAGRNRRAPRGRSGGQADFLAGLAAVFLSEPELLEPLDEELSDLVLVDFESDFDSEDFASEDLDSEDFESDVDSEALDSDADEDAFDFDRDESRLSFL